MTVIGALYHLFRPPREIRVAVRDMIFEIPGREGDVKSLGDVPEVAVFHDGGLVLRNCHIRGAIELKLHSAEGVLVIKGLAGTAIRYVPPGGGGT